MNSHAQQVADLEALTADFFSPRAEPGSRRRPDPIVYALRTLPDSAIRTIIAKSSGIDFAPACAYAAAVGRTLDPNEWHHLFVTQLERDWAALTTMEQKIARLRHFHKFLEIAW